MIKKYFTSEHKNSSNDQNKVQMSKLQLIVQIYLFAYYNY